jgi:formylglycine-generating enzyme required for sulfatase activity
MEVKLTATPASTHKFVKWIDLADTTTISTADVFTVTMTRDMKLRAVFEAFKYTVNQDDTAMVFVQGGSFRMGCTPEQGSDCYPAENTVEEAADEYNVVVNSFHISKYPVTQRLWKQVMGSTNNPSRFVGDDRPVEGVTWGMAQNFIAALNGNANGSNPNRHTYRLPTEAEWEYAARGGASSGKYKYSGSDDIDAIAWHADNSGGETHPVGAKLPNELGIHDMAGNVWEWVNDWWGLYDTRLYIGSELDTADGKRELTDRYGPDVTKINPAGPDYRNTDVPIVYANPGVGEFISPKVNSATRASLAPGRVYRGGGWSAGARGCRVSTRNLGTEGYREGLGFRLVISASVPQYDPIPLPENPVSFKGFGGSVGP